MNGSDKGRRDFLRSAGLIVGGLSITGFGVRLLNERLTPPEVEARVSSEVERSLAQIAAAPNPMAALEAGIPGLAAEITPNDRFYVVSKNVFRDPIVDSKSWRLEVTGLVDRPLSLSYEALKGLPAVEQYLTLQCISNEVGGELMGNAYWRGVALAELLNRAGLQPGAADVIVHAGDDYTDSIPIEKALQPGTMLAFEMNGQQLPANHGFPARLLIPDIYGMKNVKWVTRMEVVDYDFKGYWQTRGWSDVATMKTTSRIDIPKNRSFLRPGRNFVGGVAVAGQRGIQSVEVSVDGGTTWSQALTKPALGPFAWTLWLFEWDLSDSSDERSLMVRARDGNGALQSGVRQETLPDGASGYHAITTRRAQLL